MSMVINNFAGKCLKIDCCISYAIGVYLASLAPHATFIPGVLTSVGEPGEGLIVALAMQ